MGFVVPHGRGHSCALSSVELLPVLGSVQAQGAEVVQQALARLALQSVASFETCLSPVSSVRPSSTGGMGVVDAGHCHSSVECQIVESSKGGFNYSRWDS